MPLLHIDPLRSVVVVVDIQSKFMAAIDEADRVRARSLFLVRAAHLLGIPVIASEQNPDRMGSIEANFLPYLGARVAKMTFSAAESDEFMGALAATGRDQVVLVGVETHICVCLTALGLVRRDYEVVVCPDAASSRTNDRHKLGMERLRDSGVMPAHTESVAYEWMRSASAPQFKEFLGLVKDA